MSKLRYSTVENETTGHEAIKLLEDPYSGIIFTYGKVSFEEDDANDHLKIKFDYDILYDPLDERNGFVKEEFEQYIGDLLQELLHQELAKNNVTYTGGVDDENRTCDIIESDSE